MIGVVIVSHSAKLAEGVIELASQVAQGKVRFAAAGGTSDAKSPIGTDAFRVLEAIESVFSEDGVLVFMDLGSAVLSAETAVELLDERRRARVRLCTGSLVERAVAAVSLAAAGATLDEITAEPAPPLSDVRSEECTVTLHNRLGLHARPAARLIRLARRFDARITIENLTAHTGPCDAASLNGILTLAARQNHQLRFRAQGIGARQALEELVAFVESGCDDDDGETAPGIAASPGIAIGPLIRFKPAPIVVEKRVTADPAAEWTRLERALSAAQNGSHDILDAQSLFLEDPQLLARARQLIYDDHLDAASAWQSTAAEFAARLGAIDDPYISARQADLSDAADRVLQSLTGASASSVKISQPSILAAHDLLPSQVEKLDPSLVLGVCLETGSATAHSAILARARAIPAVVGLGPALSSVAEGTIVAIDGEQGRLWVSPDETQIQLLEERRRAWMSARNAAQAGRRAPSFTRDGRRISVLANISRESEAGEAINCGAEGVGVLRTEFLFLNRQTAPDEDEQFAAYRTIAQALGGRPLVIRTLDIGGDKPVPYVDIGPEANPFLGWRGIRLTLGRRDLFETQLRAILRTSRDYPVEVLLPMVSALEELREAKSVIATLDPRASLPIGVMIEVPSAAVIADQLAAEVTRLSIGTNDLVQYLLAADRTNPRVAHSADHFQPALLRTIEHVVSAGRQAGIRVDVCGEMAADVLATPLLLGLGVEEFSVSPAFIPQLKKAIATCTLADAQALAQKVLHAPSSAAVRRMLSR
jgi:phosphoenolpyruvate-protein phosphotransferase/dihydroxyacetone kinase phosphotransfer subunit